MLESLRPVNKKARHRMVTSVSLPPIALTQSGGLPLASPRPSLSWSLFQSLLSSSLGSSNLEELLDMYPHPEA